MTTGRINQVAIGQTCETSVKGPFRRAKMLDRPGNDFRVRRKQPKLRTAFCFFLPSFSRPESEKWKKIARGLATDIPLKKQPGKPTLALPKRRPDSHYWGRPYQDRVRSVIIVRQDRHDSRDQQPRRAISRWTACRKLGSLAAGQSLSCLYQVGRVRSTYVDPPD